MEGRGSEEEEEEGGGFGWEGREGGEFGWEGRGHEYSFFFFRFFSNPKMEFPWFVWWP